MLQCVRLAAVVLVVGLAGQAAAAIRDPYPLTDVVARSKRGDSPATLVATLKSYKTTYALKGSDYGKLRAAGVADPVLDFLQQSFYNDVELLIRYWVEGQTLGRCGKCYPQQADLSQLATDGIIALSAPPLRTFPGRALGLPDWYRTTRGHSFGNGINVEALRQMGRDGRAEDEMLKALQSRPVIDVIGVGGRFSFGTRLEVGITGETFADMRDEGIPDAVLDELQRNYLSVFVEHQRLRFLQLGRSARP